MLEQLPSEFVASLLAEIGVNAAKGVFGYFGRSDAPPELSKARLPAKEDEFEPDPVEYGDETPQFLARQRLHHRMDLSMKPRGRVWSAPGEAWERGKRCEVRG